MVAGKQGIRNLFALPDLRAGVLGIFQQIIVKTFRYAGVLIFQNAGNHPGNRVDHHHCRKLSSGQHIISDGNRIGHDLLDHALVDSFIMPTQKNQLFLLRKLLCHLLGKGFALGTHKQHPHRLFALCRLCDGFPGIINRLRLHQHARAAAVRVIVHLIVLILRIIADIDRMDSDQPFLDRPSQNARLQSVFHHFRKQCQNMKLHLFVSPPAIRPGYGFSSVLLPHRHPAHIP